jgi:hypothetical protein
MTKPNSPQLPVADVSRPVPRWRLSWTSFGLCLLYVYTVVICIWMAGGLHAATAGPRTWLWYPLAPQAWVLDHTGLGWVLECVTWRDAYLRVGGVTLLLLFGLGYGIERVWRLVRR